MIKTPPQPPLGKGRWNALPLTKGEMEGVSDIG